MPFFPLTVHSLSGTLTWGSFAVFQWSPVAASLENSRAPCQLCWHHRKCTSHQDCTEPSRVRKKSCRKRGKITAIAAIDSQSSANARRGVADQWKWVDEEDRGNARSVCRTAVMPFMPSQVTSCLHAISLFEDGLLLLTSVFRSIAKEAAHILSNIAAAQSESVVNTLVGTPGLMQALLQVFLQAEFALRKEVSDLAFFCVQCSFVDCACV